MKGMYDKKTKRKTKNDRKFRKGTKVLGQKRGIGIKKRNLDKKRKSTISRKRKNITECSEKEKEQWTMDNG
jgi:hypothetical protein